MKIEVDGKELFTLTELQKLVLQYDIAIDEFDYEIKRRIIYYPIHKCEQCFKRMKLEWIPKLAARGFEDIPSDDEEFAKLVFEQPDYKDKTARNTEVKLK